MTYDFKCCYCLALMAIVASAAAADRSSKETIREAMSAAPSSISARATIKDHPDQPGGEMPVLREGTKGWTCFPDNPRLPGRNPACLIR